jgi:hypothetical protein
MARLPKMSTPKVAVPRTFADYQAKQRQTGMFKALAKPAKLSAGSAAKIRAKVKGFLTKG